jgi:hypothetical protein
MSKKFEVFEQGVVSKHGVQDSTDGGAPIVQVVYGHAYLCLHMHQICTCAQNIFGEPCLCVPDGHAHTGALCSGQTCMCRSTVLALSDLQRAWCMHCTHGV